MIEYIKGDLFKLAPKQAFLLHACNGQGKWGSGIAWQFRQNYPLDYKEYQQGCEKFGVGETFITSNKIICLLTSHIYSPPEPAHHIVGNTARCLAELVDILPADAIIYSPKINAGLFNTPWEYTESLIEIFLKERQDVTWVVVEYDSH